MKTTNEMMNDVIKMKENNENEIWFEATKDISIFVDVVKYANYDIEISIELRNIDTNETIESTTCDYYDNEEIKTCLGYIRACV